MNISPYYQKLLKLLRVRGTGGGLEITDTALRFAWNEGNGWQFASVRLPQGVVQGGQLIDVAQFNTALASLREQMFGGKKKDVPLHTIVSLGAREIYLQVFNLPLLSGDQLKEAVMLNLKVASPIEESKSYTGWQIVGQDEKSAHFEILSAFIERADIDAFIAPLKAAGFIPGAVEPAGLSLARVIRMMGAGFDSATPTIVVATEDTGVRLLVVRNGMLYFQYFTAWSEIQGENKEISWEVFSTAFIEQFRKVLNFYGLHWTGAVAGVLLVAGNLEEGLVQLIGTQFGLPAQPLRLDDASVTPEWFYALGAGARSMISLREDSELSLLGVTAREEFVVQQAKRFMKFWRIAFPAALIILLAVTFGASRIIARNFNDITAKARAIDASDQGREILALQQQAASFNGVVQSLQAVTGVAPIVPLAERVRTFLNTYGASFSRLSIDRTGNVSLDGHIPSEEQLLKLADALRKNTEFKDLDLPLQQIRTDQNGVSFALSFTITPSNTP